MLLRPSSLLFSLTLVIGTIMTASSTSWYMSWLGLEINTLSFIPLIWAKKNSFSTQAALKYFLIQAFSSSLLIGSIVLTPLSPTLTLNLMITALILKMGAAPLHFWLPPIMQNLSWYQCIMLMTIQKIAPMTLTYYSMAPTNNWMIMFSSISSALFGSVGGLNQTLLRKILAYSSISHMAWLLAAMFAGTANWISYFIIYSLTSTTFSFLLNSSQTFHIKQLSSVSSNPTNMIAIFTSLFSLGGLPPFLGFLPKMSVTFKMIFLNMIPWLTILIMSSLITLFFYTRLAIMSLTLHTPKIKTNQPTNLKMVQFLLINTIPTLIPMLAIICF